jgi:broad specificity phosphatase PhoE
MGRIFLARHGATAWSGSDPRYCGVTDLALSDAGRQQAGALARRLRDEPLAAVIATDLIRSQETARPVADSHGLEVETVAPLRELDYGEWEGLTRTEIEQRYPDALRDWIRDRVRVSVPGGESLRSLLDRALPALLALAERFGDRPIAVVGHNTTNRVLLCHLLDVPIAHYRRILQSPAGLNVIDIEGDHACVAAINERCHLRGL